MPKVIELSRDDAYRAVVMWRGGFQATEIARALNVNAKWFEGYRTKRRDQFPLRNTFKMRRQEMQDAMLMSALSKPPSQRPNVMTWRTESGAVVSLPRISGITCPRMNAQTSERADTI